MNFLSIEPIRGDRVLVPEHRIRRIVIEPELSGGEGGRVRVWTWRRRTFYVSHVSRIQSVALEHAFPFAPAPASAESTVSEDGQRTEGRQQPQYRM